MGVSKVNYGSKTLIDLTGDTVTSDKLLSGYTAHDKSGNAITGTKTFKTQSKHVYPSRVDQNVTPNSGYDGLSKVTVYALRHSRIAKTMGSSDVSTYSIPISEIGFEPRIWAFTMYSKTSSTIANTKISKNWILAGICDMHTYETENYSTSGIAISAGKKLITFGTSEIGEVNGSNFVFSNKSNYVYFANSMIYRFYFWG